MANLEIDAELYRRGALPAHRVPVFEELARRGAVPGFSFQGVDPGGQAASPPSAMPADDFDAALLDDGRAGYDQPSSPRLNAQGVDESTGASWKNRFIIGSAADQQTRLARARDLYGDSARDEGDGGISFLNPETGRRTLVNPTGFDAGDLFGGGREILSGAAGILPFAVGTASTGVGGIAAGSAAGAAAGQVVDTLAAKLARWEAERRGATPSSAQSPLDAAKEFGTEAALGTAGGVGLSLAAKGLGSAYRGARSAIDAFTPAGRERIAGQTLNRLAANPEAAQATLARGAEEFVPGSLPTTAQATGDAGLAVLEKGLASSGGGSALQERMVAQEAARQTAMRQSLTGSAPHGGTLGAEEVGMRVRGAYDAAHGTAKQATRDAYAAIDPQRKTAFDVAPLIGGIREDLSSLGAMADIGMPGKVNQVLSRMEKAAADGKTYTFNDLQSARHIFSDAAREAESGSVESMIANTMKKRMDGFIEGTFNPQMGGREAAMQQAREMAGDLTAQGYSPAAAEKVLNQLADDIARQQETLALQHVGMRPEQARAFQLAKDLRKVQADRFETGANQRMGWRGNSLEGGAIPTSRVPENYFRAGQQGGESMRAFTRSVGDNPEARTAMQDYAITRAMEKAARADGSLDINKLSTFVRDHRPALRELGLEKIAEMSKVRADLERFRKVSSLAAVQGSPTAQNLATQAIVNSVTGSGGGIGTGSGFMESLGKSVMAAAPLRKAFFEPSSNAIREVLLNASLDPQLALRLMRQGMPAKRGKPGRIAAPAGIAAGNLLRLLGEE